MRQLELYCSSAWLHPEPVSAVSSPSACVAGFCISRLEAVEVFLPAAGALVLFLERLKHRQARNKQHRTKATVQPTAIPAAAPAEIEDEEEVLPATPVEPVAAVEQGAGLEEVQLRHAELELEPVLGL